MTKSPLGGTGTSANAYDKTQVMTLLEQKPDFLFVPQNCLIEQHFCADKGYDYQDIRKFIYHESY